MANYVTVQLDTTAPANPTVSIEGGAITTANQLATLTIGTSDGVTTGYQMKIWGTVDTAHNPNIQATEAASAWISYATSQQVNLSSGDGTKTVNVRIRDDVHNMSSTVSDTIVLDTTIPVVTVSALSVAKISLVAGRNETSFTFTVNENFVEYKVKLVGTTGATHDTGTQIPTTGGSTNVSGTGSYTSSTVTTVTLNATDLQTATANMNGNNIVKVFAKDSSGYWSS